MNILRTKHYIEFQSEDNQGEYFVRIHKDGTQLTLKSDLDEAFIDTNLIELKAIRDCLNEVIESHPQNGG